jgi:hypothetical protein
LRLGGTLAALLVLFLAALGQPRIPARTAHAHMAHLGLDFSLEVAGTPTCNTSRGDATCTLAAGHEFTVNVNLGPLPSDIPNYEGFDIYITYDGVASRGTPSTAAWPDCAFAAVAPPEAGRVAFGCAIGVPPAGPSTYTGTIGTAQFVCSQAGRIVLDNTGVNGHMTDLVESGYAEHTDPTPTETLNITCGAPLARFADANCDGLANSVDAFLVLQWDAHLIDRLPCPDGADANADGVVDAVDASLILQASAGLLEMPPPPMATATPTPTPTPTSTPISTTQTATPTPSSPTPMRTP